MFGVKFALPYFNKFSYLYLKPYKLIFDYFPQITKITIYSVYLFYQRNDFSTFQLLSGKAEVFGSELTSGRKYAFITGSKVAVFTWHGCHLKISFVKT